MSAEFEISEMPPAPPRSSGLQQLFPHTPEEVRKAQEAARRRILVEHYAGQAMQGLLMGGGFNSPVNDVAFRAVNQAEAMVAELERRKR